MAQPAVAAPIMGPQNREQLAQNLAAADVAITDDSKAAVDQIAPPREAVFRLSRP